MPFGKNGKIAVLYVEGGTKGFDMIKADVGQVKEVMAPLTYSRREVIERFNTEEIYTDFPLVAYPSSNGHQIAVHNFSKDTR